ncbi:MAG TPA: TIGR04076 family protein [candidate division Zixibacteria bacterium]|nr:TIGR04076 family protein [candidate division Zixibacteria bacterium]
MTKFKITVVKKFGPEDVLGHDFFMPSGKKIIKCDFKEGDSYISIDGNIPKGFCNAAWAVIFPRIQMFRFGGNFPAFDPGTTYTTCPDGIRPVSFKVEMFED